MSNGGAVAEHDSGYKLLFSHPEMVEDLIRGFVHEDWVRDLDFSTLKKVPGNYVAPNLMPRESDCVWKLRWKDDRVLYVYLLMEFQSTVDSSMALRMMVYLGLFYQDLLKRGEITPSGKLPPVLPLVLYNGYAPWGAAREVSELIEEVPGGLEKYRPQLRYCLLDEMRMADSELEPLRNLAAVMVRLEKSRGTEAMERVFRTSERLREPGLEGVRRSFALWVLRVLLPSRIRGVRFPEYLDLEEIQRMLAESGFSWSDQWMQEGMERERQEALSKARTILLRDLERRFGPLPETILRRVDAIGSIEELTEFSLRVGAASSLAELT
ncbi:MAG TPA: Rpn family recombination-promoting nuclease/putative transposase, partial [Thermoanaerobaculia bacterium]